MKKVLFITTGFPPYLFSENIVNGKLVLALLNAGYEVDVISRKDEGCTYDSVWQEPFIQLKEVTTEISYELGNKFSRILDVLFSSIKMGYWQNGIRWARRTYEKATQLIDEKHYDLIITRSPSDIPHLVGLQLKKKKNITWLANWNDPATTIWPMPYAHKLGKLKKQYLRSFEQKVLKNADYLSFPSHTLKEHFNKSYNLPHMEEKQFIIPHISLLETLIEKRKKVKDKNILKFCHAGNLSIERNPEKLFIAIKQLTDEKAVILQLDILGTINLQIEKLIEKYELENIVHFIGALPYIQAMNKMREYDALILLEAELDFGIFFPSKLVDYVQLGVPILALSPLKGYIQEMMSLYGGGICVDNSDAKQIAIGVKNLYNILIQGNDSDELSNGLKELYSTKTVVDIYDKIIDE